MSSELESLDIGFGPGKWGNDTWNTVVSMSPATGSVRSLEIVQAVFAFLLLVGLLVLSVGIFFLKASKRDALKPMPLTTTLAAMFFMVA